MAVDKNVTFQQISKFLFENWFCNASNVSFYSCRVINTVVKPRKCIDIVLRVNKIIKQLRCEEYFGGEYTYLTDSEIAFLMVYLHTKTISLNKRLKENVIFVCNMK